MPVLISRIASTSAATPVGVLGLDDPLDVAVGVADDAAVGAGVVELDRHHGRGGAGGAVGLEQRRRRSRAVISGWSPERTTTVSESRTRSWRGADRAAGAVGLGLDDGLGALGEARR